MINKKALPKGGAFLSATLYKFQIFLYFFSKNYIVWHSFCILYSVKTKIKTSMTKKQIRNLIIRANKKHMEVDAEEYKCAKEAMLLYFKEHNGEKSITFDWEDFDCPFAIFSPGGDNYNCRVRSAYFVGELGRIVIDLHDDTSDGEDWDGCSPYDCTDFDFLDLANHVLSKI